MRSILIASVLATLALTAHAGDDDGHHHRDRQVPKVFDAQGREVGPLESDAGQNGVYIEINGAITFVPIGRVGTAERASATQFQWGSDRPILIGTVAYPSSDCSGTPVLIYSFGSGTQVLLYTSGPRPSIAVRQGADVTVYIASDADSGPVNVQSSHLNSNFSECTRFVATITAWTVGSSYVITQHHPEPLTIHY
ncbi:hypothetical protein IAG25_28635 [Caballeronia sp. EK]|jgi:hypothetical protein|uniref:hypothetical protein n=1 Tax=Caballeronia TaxID=1827195 RepID=UPI001655489B|nr:MULTISPECIES: hypothetical protein [Caballeronia]MBC8640789.1 hypothetical protein [Caballeronia sp. EK]GJH14760.1 hypothetical protein CBA19CS11_38000 [Caballeronia novacaledonica]